MCCGWECDFQQQRNPERAVPKIASGLQAAAQSNIVAPRTPQLFSLTPHRKRSLSYQQSPGFAGNADACPSFQVDWASDHKIWLHSLHQTPPENLSDCSSQLSASGVIRNASVKHCISCRPVTITGFLTNSCSVRVNFNLD